MVSLTAQAISNSEQTIIKSVLGDENKVFASVVTRLYFAENGSKQWKRIKEAGALNFCQSTLNGAFYFNLVDLQEKRADWSQEIYLDFKYHRDMEYFHSFEGDKGMFGILFTEPSEADKFYEIVMAELENYTAAEKMPSKSKSSRTKSIFGAFSFGRRSSKTAEAEESSEISSSEKEEAQRIKNKKEKKQDSDLTHDDVSEPRDFTHLSHIGFNPTKGTFDIENIPDEWKTMFAKAGITHDQLESRSTAKFIAGFVQDSEPQMKSMMAKRASGSRPPAPVPLKKKAAPPPPPPTPTRNKNAATLKSPKKTSTSAPPPPPPKKASNNSKAAANGANGATGVQMPPPPPPPSQTQPQSQMPAKTSVHSALLDSIKGAGIGILKPVNSTNDSDLASPSASSANPHSALMASIKGGASLRPASKIDRSPSSPTSSVASSDPTDMMAAMLAKALAARNKKLAADSSDDDGDSDDSRCVAHLKRCSTGDQSDLRHIPIIQFLYWFLSGHCLFFMESSTSSVNSSNISSILPILNTYDTEKKFTLYSERTELRQSDSIYNLHEKESLTSLTKDNLFWLDIKGPDRSDLKTISELFKIHPLTIEDILSEDGREKTERFENYIFVCIRACGQEDENSKMSEPLSYNKIFLLLFPKHIITIHNQSIRQVRHVIRRVNPLKNVLKVTSDWFMYALLDDVVDEFTPSIKTMESEVEEIDDIILYLKRTSQTEMLRRIGYSRNRVNQLIRLLRPKIEIINILTKRHAQQLEENTLLYLRDTQDHLMGMIQVLEQNSETLNRSHNNYLAQISIELAEMSNKMNMQVQILTKVTSLALPFAIIGGLWGMNVVVPFEIVNGSMATWDMLMPFWSLVILSITLSVGFWFMGRQIKFF